MIKKIREYATSVYAIVSAHHLNPIIVAILLPYIGPTVSPKVVIHVKIPDEISVTSFFLLGNLSHASVIRTEKLVIQKKFAKSPFKNWPTHIRAKLSGSKGDGPTSKFEMPHKNKLSTISNLLSNLLVKKLLLSLQKHPLLQIFRRINLLQLMSGENLPVLMTLLVQYNNIHSMKEKQQ